MLYLKNESYSTNPITNLVFPYGTREGFLYFCIFKQLFILTF